MNPGNSSETLQVLENRMPVSCVLLLLLEALLMRLSAIRSLSFAKKTGERGKNRGMDILHCKFPYPISSMYRLVPVQALNAKRRYEE